MIVAVDTNCILPGQVGGIENYTLGLIEALKIAAITGKKAGSAHPARKSRVVCGLRG